MSGRRIEASCERAHRPAAPGPNRRTPRSTEAERKLVARLLSDPTYFPVEFRTWLRTYLEGSGIQLPASAIIGGGGGGKKLELPPGIIIPHGGGTIPADALACNGAAISRTDYNLLFAQIGTTWGVGNGVDTFNIPDFRDRALYGVGSQVGLGVTDGRAAGTRGGPKHKHSFSQTSQGGGGHGHSWSGSTGNAGGHTHSPSGGPSFAVGNFAQAALGSGGTSRYLVGNFDSFTGSAPDHSHSVSGSVGAVGDHTHLVSGDTSGGFDYDRPSFAGVNYIITTGVAV